MFLSLVQIYCKGTFNGILKYTFLKSMEDQWLILLKVTVRIIKFYHIKIEVVTIFTDVTVFDVKHKFTSAT